MKRRDALLVLVPAALVACTRLGLRDLSGEEVVFYFGLGPWGIARQALDPGGEGAFHAHQPLSYLVRWVFTSLLGVAPATLRIHAALFAVAGAAATWWVAARRGNRVGAVVAGLLVGCSPVMAFYSHEASNYAATPLFAALVLAAIQDLREGDDDRRRRGRHLLVVGLVGGMLNDFFFGFAVVAAAAITPWGRREARLAWAASCGALLLPAVFFARSLAQVPPAKRFAPHLDPSAGAEAWSGVRLFGWMTEGVAGFFQGYGRGAWDSGPLSLASGIPLLMGLAVVAVVISARGGRLRGAGSAAVFAVVVFACAALFEGWVGLHDGSFPPAVRAVLASVPALALVYSMPSTGRFSSVVSGVVGLGLLLCMVETTLPVVLRPPQGQARIATRLASEASPRDLVLAAPNHAVSFGPRTSFDVRTPASGCLEGPITADRVWVVSTGWAAQVQACDGVIDLAAAGYGPLVFDQYPLPWHDEQTPAFLPPHLALSGWKRGAPPEGEAPFLRRVGLEGPGDQSSGLSLVFERPDGVRRHREVPAEGALLALPMPRGTRVRARDGWGDGVHTDASFDLVGPRTEQLWTFRRDGRALRRRGAAAGLAIACFGGVLALVLRFVAVGGAREPGRTRGHEAPPGSGRGG